MSITKALTFLIVAGLACLMIVRGIEHVISPWFSVVGIWMLFGIAYQEIFSRVDQKIKEKLKSDEL